MNCNFILFFFFFFFFFAHMYKAQEQGQIIPEGTVLMSNDRFFFTVTKVCKFKKNSLDLILYELFFPCEQTMLAFYSECCITSLKASGPLAPQKNLKGFYSMWAWWSSWSCDQDPANKLSFPRHMEASYAIWLQSAQ